MDRTKSLNQRPRRRLRLLSLTMMLSGFVLAPGLADATPGNDDDDPKQPGRIMWPRPPVTPKETDRRPTKPATSRQARPPRVMWPGLKPSTTPQAPKVAIAPEPPVTPSLVALLLEPTPQPRGQPRASASSMFRAARIGAPRSQTTALEPKPLPPATIEAPRPVLLTDLPWLPTSQRTLHAQASTVVLKRTPELAWAKRVEPAPLVPLGIAISGAVFGSSGIPTSSLPTAAGPTLAAVRAPLRFSASLWASAAESQGSEQQHMLTTSLKPQAADPPEAPSTATGPSQAELAETTSDQDTTPSEEPRVVSQRNPLTEPQDGSLSSVAEPALATRLNPNAATKTSDTTDGGVQAPDLNTRQAQSAHRISPALWQQAEASGNSSVLVAAGQPNREMTPDPDRQSRGAIRATAPVWGPARPVAGPSQPSALVARVDEPKSESPPAAELDQPSSPGGETTDPEADRAQDPDLIRSQPEAIEPPPQVAVEPVDPKQRAIRELEQRVQREPEQAEIWFYLGRLYLQADPPDWTRADNALRTVVTLDQDFSEAWFELGLLLLQQDQVLEAVDMLERCVKRDPSHVNAYNALGNARLRLGQSDSAMEAYELAVEALKIQVAHHVDRSRQLRAEGLHRDALEEAALALRLDPLDGPALLCHGLALVALDDHQAARKDLELLWLNHPPLAERLRRVLVD